MRNQILEDLKTAMKNQDKEKLAVIRMVKGAIQMSELNKKHELSDEEVIDVITKEIKSRKDSINEFSTYISSLINVDTLVQLMREKGIKNKKEVVVYYDKWIGFKGLGSPKTSPIIKILD